MRRLRSWRVFLRSVPWLLLNRHAMHLSTEEEHGMINAIDIKKA